MSPLYLVLAVIYVLFCLFFVSIILLQKQRSTGIGNIGGGMGGNGNAMGRTTDDNLANLTKYLGAVFFAFTILMSFVK